MQVLVEAKRISELHIKIIFISCFYTRLIITCGEEEEDFLMKIVIMFMLSIAPLL